MDLKKHQGIGIDLFANVVKALNVQGARTLVP